MINLSPTYDKTYTVSDPALAWPLVIAGLTTQVPACGYEQTFTFLHAPSFESGNPLTFSVTTANINFNLYTTDLENVDERTITLSSTL